MAAKGPTAKHRIRAPREALHVHVGISTPAAVAAAPARDTGCTTNATPL